MIILTLVSLLVVAGASQTCTSEEIATYKNNNLSSKCSVALNDVSVKGLLHRQKFNIPSESSLVEVCQQSCGGLYSSWLSNTCKDNSAARIVQATCLFTSNTSPNGGRCRHLFPDVTDIRTNFIQFYDKCEPILPRRSQTCYRGCAEVLMSIVSHLGCCYQSLYNNTEFVNGFKNSGLINDTIAAGILNMGRSTAWTACGVKTPRRCEEIQILQIAPSSCYIHYISIALLIILLFGSSVHNFDFTD